jgi:hypothetical protein
MKASPVILPSGLQDRLGVDAPAQFMAVGNTALLAEPLLGLIASRECPGQVLLDTLELAANWARSQQVVFIRRWNNRCCAPCCAARAVR